MTRIMIVEDDDEIPSILCLFFAENGYEVVKSVPELVFNNVIKDKPDLVLLDVWSSGGHTADSICYQLKNNSSTKDIPVLVISDAKNLFVAKNCNADAYIEKPFNLYEVLATVQKFIA